MAMAASLESVILKLLQNTTNEGQAQGFKEIQELFKDPSIIISLCQCITQSPDPQVRRYAALLLRRRILKAKQWKKISQDVKQGLKQTILEAYVKDTEKVVRNAIAELIASIAKHELSEGKWPELMALIDQSIRSNNTVDREVALYSLSVIAKTLGQKLKPHFRGLLSLFQNTLTDTSSIDIPYFTIRALTYMVISIGTEELNLFQSLLPNVIVVIKLMATNDQEKACECLEIFDELVECEVAVLAPHIKSLIDLGLELAASDKFDNELRIKAVNLIAYLIRLKKKAIIKQRLAQPILEVFFPLMCNPSPGDKDEIDEDELETSLPSAAGQALDIMALHLPPAKLLPLLMHHLQAAFENNNPHHRKAAFLALSVIAEGCSEFIRHKYLPVFIPVIIRGIKDPDEIVRNAALYAIGQYAEYLQPEISKYAPELLPVLFEYLQQTCVLLQQGNKNPPNLTRTFYAVERFCENLEDILPYLPTLMNCLSTFLNINTEKSSVVKEMAIEAIGSVAAAAKTNFAPYFNPVVEHLKTFICAELTEETAALQTQSIDTLAVVLRTVGAETALPVAHDCIKCGLFLIEKNDDPDVRRSCYSMFASVACVLKVEIAPYLNTIIERILVTLKSTEGISINTSVGENTGFTLFEEEEESENGEMGENDFENLEGTEEDDDDDDDVTGYSVENAYIEEKEGACLALKEIAEHIGVNFLPFMEASFNEVRKLIEHLSDDVRRSAIGTLGQFCITLNEIFLETGNLECRVALDTHLGVLLPKLFSLTREDTEHTVVLGCLETLQNIVDKVKENAIHAGHLESISLLIKDVFKNKLACQDEAENDDEDDQEGEYDNMVMEYAGELIASLIKVVPWQQFAPYLAGLMPFLLAKSKKACTVSEKSFSIGTLAEIVSCMEPGSVKPFLGHLQPVFLAGMRDENEEIRSNAVYGLGVLAENAGQLVFDQYPLYLQSISNMITTEEDPRAKDNICGAVARLIKTNLAGVSLNQVFPVFLQYLPMKEDLEENATVLGCFAYLYNIRNELFFQSLPQILKILSETPRDKLNENAVVILQTLLNNLSVEFPNEFESILKSLPQENVEALLKARSAT